MGERVSYPSNGGISEGHLALPGGPGPGPGVIVIQERWGLVSHLVSLAGRFPASSRARTLEALRSRPA